MCFEENLELHGDYNAAEAEIINVFYEKCNNKTISPPGTCHSEEEILGFIKRKFIVVV